MQFRRYSLFESLKREEFYFYPLVIEIKRIILSQSKKALCDGVCTVNQYEMFVSNELTMPEEIGKQLMAKLGITFYNDKEFVTEGFHLIGSLIEENMFNEFDQAFWRFDDIESNEEKYLCSPLIIEFILVRMAYYSVNSRERFLESKAVLRAVKKLMTREQKFLFYLFDGVDAYKVRHDPQKARKLLDKARQETGHPHVYLWIGVLELDEGNVLTAVKMFEKAQRRYVNDGNITGLVFVKELIGLSYYRQNDYESGIDVFRGALGYARSLNRSYLVNNFSNQIAWGYFRMRDYEQSLKAMVKDRYNDDLTVNSSVTKFLIAYHTVNAGLLDELREEFSNRNKTLHRMIESILSKDPLFDENSNPMIDEEELKALSELAEITHFELKKEFFQILLSYYVKTDNKEGIIEMLKHRDLKVGKL